MNQYNPQFPPSGHPGSAYYPPPPPPQNGLGTAGFVLGLLGLLFSFIPVIGIIAWPLVLLGLVLSGVGLAKARASRATNTGLAVAGLVCSAVGLLVCIVYAAAFGAAVSAASSAVDDAPAISAPSGDSPPQAPGVETAAARIGEEVRDGSFAFTVTSVETGIERLGESFLQSEAQGSYVLVHVTVTNIGSEAELFSGSSQKLLDAQGRTFDADSGAAVMNLPDSESFLNNINPGNSVNGSVVFDVPEGLVPMAIELHESPWSAGATVALDG
ncbi:DUF4352 domain-containing protein [Pseudonocardia nigra]|uniref:DUF4352 domain-containing protein n=1 Tax=Pseudonocardia nigra TaxID=1921578 RepID=UPI001C5F81CD|nr:DUF4352 domain-containing protein [Pseudonocardia nigra]